MEEQDEEQGRLEDWELEEIERAARADWMNEQEEGDL